MGKKCNLHYDRDVVSVNQSRVIQYLLEYLTVAKHLCSEN